eukprot:13496807-Heterocapsa_arctica.AAC.1
MYKKPRLIQVHKASTDLAPANGGIVAGCGFAVHYLKEMSKVDVKEEGKKLRYFVDDMVLFKESDNKNVVVEGIIVDLDRTKGNSRLLGKGSMMEKSKYLYLLSQLRTCSGNIHMIIKKMLGKLWWTWVLRTERTPELASTRVKE